MVCLKSPPCPDLPQLTVAVALTCLFACQYGWQTLYHTWKNANKETSSKSSSRPNFYQCLYLTVCPQIHFVFYSGLWLLPSALVPPLPLLHRGLTKNVWAYYMKMCLHPPFFPSNKFEDFAMKFFFPNTSKVVVVAIL